MITSSESFKQQQQTYRFLIILKHLSGLLYIAELFFTLSLQVVLLHHFFKMATVVSAQTM